MPKWVSGSAGGGLTPEQIVNDPTVRAAFASSGGPSYVAKPSGDGRAGVLDWRHNDATGYLLHLNTRENTGVNTAAIGIGTDRGAGSGILLSHKNSGAGERIIQQPGSGFGQYVEGWAVNPATRADIHAGSGGISWNLATGQGFPDGATTAGSTTLTSATAAFTAADVGRTVAQLTSRDSADPMGSIPTGTTITAVTSGTTATMSKPAGATATGLLFQIAGRPVPDQQPVLRLFGADGTTVLGIITDAGLDWRAGNVARPAGKFRAKAGQTASILEVTDSTNTILSRFGPSGHMMTRKTAAPADAELANGEVALWWDATPGTGGLRYKGKLSDGSVKTGSL